MSIEPYVERWRRRFLFCLALSVAGLLLTGAKEITRELRQRPAHLQTVQERMANWAHTLAWESPDAQHDEWSNLVAESPEVLIRVCSRRDGVR